MTLKGKAQVDAALDKAMASFAQRLGGAMYVVANNFMTEAKRITPHDTGTLMSSGYVTLPQQVGTGVSVEMGFGGFAKEYAVIQHEKPMNHDPGRQDKYLSDPLDRERPRLIADVAAAMRLGKSLLGSGGSLGMNVHPNQGGRIERVGRKNVRKLKPRKTGKSKRRRAGARRAGA